MPRSFRHALAFAAAVASCFTLQVAGQALHRPVITRVAPAYPELARRMHVAGVVVVEVSVRPDGTVSDTHAQSGHALLVAAAEDAVRQWHFAAAPDASHLVIDVAFVAPGN